MDIKGPEILPAWYMSAYLLFVANLFTLKLYSLITFRYHLTGCPSIFRTMYSEWTSLQQDIQSDSSKRSVLHQFPETVGKDVAGSVVKTLAQSLSSGAANGEASTLKTDQEVKWTMEVRTSHIYSF